MASYWWVLIVVLCLTNIVTVIYVIQRAANRQTAQARQEASVRSSGEAARALIMESTDTGTRYGAFTFLLIRLRLRVSPAFGDAFETTIEAKISPVRVPDFAEGKEIAVRIAPDTRQVVIDQRVQ